MENQVTPEKKKTKAIKPMEQVKFLMSSLFGRQMCDMIIGGEPDKENVFYFSNIELEEIDMYEQDLSKYVHKVTIYNEDILNALNTICPLFKDHVLHIDTKAFLSALTKEAKNEYHFETTNTNKVILTSATSYYEVGTMISNFIASMYVSLFNQSEITHEDQWHRNLDISELNLDRPTFLQIFNNNRNEMSSKAIITPSKNIVCLKEYLAKTHISDYLITLKAYGEASIKLECDFNTKDLKVQSVQPSIRYYRK